MTEVLVVNALRSGEATEMMVSAVCHHEKWSRRNEIKIALLSNEKTPLAKITQFAGELPVRALKDILRNSRLSENVKEYLETVVEERTGAP